MTCNRLTCKQRSVPIPGVLFVLVTLNLPNAPVEMSLDKRYSCQSPLKELLYNQKRRRKGAARMSTQTEVLVLLQMIVCAASGKVLVWID